MERILVATDGSPGGGRAVDAAIEISKAFNAELLIVAVEQGYLRAKDVACASRGESIDEVLYGTARQILEEADKLAYASGLQKIRTVANLGEPAANILQIANTEKADLVVVGRRGRGRLAGLLIGSVSQKVAVLASCKVLIVP